jgi:hypothetical protein
MRHVLKTDSDVFKESWQDNKLYELRFDDREYKVGDELVLVETRYTGLEMKEGKPLEYTGFYLVFTVTYKIKNKYGLNDGWCLLSTFLEYCGEESPEGGYFKSHVLTGKLMWE